MYDLNRQMGKDANVPDAYQNGYFWIFSNFENDCGFSIKDNCINIEILSDNTKKAGETAFRNTNERLESFERFTKYRPESMRYESVHINYLDSKNQNNLWEVVLEPDNGSWKVAKSSGPASDFLTGVNGGD